MSMSQRAHEFYLAVVSRTVVYLIGGKCMCKVHTANALSEKRRLALCRRQCLAMGRHLSHKTTVWTFWFFLTFVKLVLSAEFESLRDIGFEILPDVTKINVSQDEYTRMMTVYLERLQDSQEPFIPKLITFNAEKRFWRRRKDDSMRLRFSITPENNLQVESAELRLLAPAFHNKNSTLISVYQVLSPRRRRLIDKRLVYLSSIAPKWCEFDVTSAMQSWLNGERNLGLDLECEDCFEAPLEAGLTVLVYPEFERKKRSLYNLEYGRRTDCANTNSNNHMKPKCCRHNMIVSFKKLDITSIIQPKYYEAGFCKGRCPLNYNHATNHSRIQNLVHRLDRKATPRACCAPSKLEPLEILRVDPNEPTKLTVETWDNMKVLECACS